MTNHAAPATAGRLPRMASTSVKFHVEHRNSEWPMALVGRRVCLKHIARTTSFTWNTRRRRGRWNGPADRIPIARTQPVGPFTPCIREVMPKEPGVVSDRLLRPVALGPDGRERRLHEADRSEFHSAIAAAHIRRQCMEFRGSWHHLTLRRCSGGAQRVDVSRETPNSGHNLRHRRDCRAENALPWPPASSDGNDGLIAPMHGRRSWQTSVRVSRHASNFSPARPRLGKCDAQWYFGPGATQAALTAMGPPPRAIHMRADHRTSAIATAAHHLPALRCASFDPHT
jgi:hypothetical protein